MIKPDSFIEYATETASEDAPMFSVIIPTRDRPVLVAAALASVAMQQNASFEIIVVNDGSNDANSETLLDLVKQTAKDGVDITLVHRPNIAGYNHQCSATNEGFEISSGAYIGLLDDDDVWTDPYYLQKVAQHIKGEKQDKVDLHLANQEAKAASGDILPGPIWLEDLGERLKAGCPDVQAFRVDAKVLLGAHGFCHMNSTIIHAPLWRMIGGFDHLLTYEYDRDFYLKAIDAAKHIIYYPYPVAEHNVPDPTRKANTSTKTNDFQKAMAQFKLLSHSAVHAQQAAVREYAQRHRRYALSKLVRASKGVSDYAKIGQAVWWAATKAA